MRVMAACLGWVMAHAAANAAPAAEPVDMLFRHWSTRDGLPNNRVRGVIRTRDGFIWLATDGGAVRFDGMNFTVFGLREGLLAPILLTIRETSDRRLWFGTLGGGLSVYRNGGMGIYIYEGSGTLSVTIRDNIIALNASRGIYQRYASATVSPENVENSRRIASDGRWWGCWPGGGMRTSCSATPRCSSQRATAPTCERVRT